MTHSMHPSALSDEDLMSVAYDDDTLSPEQRAHLAECPICKQQLALYTGTTQTLQARLYRSICPSGVRLSYYCLGIVPEEERLHIASHLLDCPACAAEVAEIRQAQATVDLYPAAWSPLAPLAPLRRIFATLVMQQAQPVLRNTAPGTGWPRQYRAETIDLSLHLSRTSNGEALLLGIITGTDPAEAVNAFEGTPVDLYIAPGPLPAEIEDGAAVQPVLSAQVDDVGNILLEEIKAGDYVLIIHLPDREVVVEGLHIESR